MSSQILPLCLIPSSASVSIWTTSVRVSTSWLCFNLIPNSTAIRFQTLLLSDSTLCLYLIPECANTTASSTSVTFFTILLSHSEPHFCLILKPTSVSFPTVSFLTSSVSFLTAVLSYFWLYLCIISNHYTVSCPTTISVWFLTVLQSDSWLSSSLIPDCTPVWFQTVCLHHFQLYFCLIPDSTPVSSLIVLQSQSRYFCIVSNPIFVSFLTVRLRGGIEWKSQKRKVNPILGGGYRGGHAPLEKVEI